MDNTELLQAIRGIVREEMEESKQILKALEHSTEVNKAVQDAMQHDIAYIKGDIEHIKGDVEYVKNKISTLETVTADNWKDIVQLKMAK